MHISSPKFIIPFLAIAGIIGALTVAAVDDTTPPSSIADLTAPTTTATTVGLRWTAPGDDGASGTAASYDVRYRTTGPINEINFATSTPAGGEPAPSVAGTLESFTVTGLTPTTTYWFALRATDDAGNASALSNAVSTTTIPADIVAPVISGVSVSNITTASARVSWNTNEAASSQVQYGTTAAYGSSTASSTLVTSHILDLASLLPATLYHFRVVSTDSASNTATSSDATFTTLATSTPDTTAPSISGVTVTDIGTTSATVRWTTNESANSLVRYGTTTSYGLNVNNASFVTTHAIPLPGLTASTLYHFAVSSADVAGNTATSTDHTFTTLSVTPPPTSTIAARLKIEPHKISLTNKPNKIGAVVKLPGDMNFNGLNESSLLLNGTVHPLTIAIGDGTCTCDGAQGYALRLTFPVDQVLALIPSTTDFFTFTLTGTATAGSFSGIDKVKIAAHSDPPSPCGRFEEVFERKSHHFEVKMEKAEKRMEKKQEQLENRKEKMRAQFEKQRERLQDKMKKLRERLNHDNDDDDDDD